MGLLLPWSSPPRPSKTDGARPLLWNLRRICRHIRLVWADSGYQADRLLTWATQLHLRPQIVRRPDGLTPSGYCRAAGSWKERSPGSASTAALSATTSAYRPATKP